MRKSANRKREPAGAKRQASGDHIVDSWAVLWGRRWHTGGHGRAALPGVVCACSRNRSAFHPAPTSPAPSGWRNPRLFRCCSAKHHSPADVARLGDRKEDLYRAEAQKGVELLPGVGALLAGLAEAGGKQAVGSSAPRKNLDLILDMTRRDVRTGSWRRLVAIGGDRKTPCEMCLRIRGQAGTQVCAL